MMFWSPPIDEFKRSQAAAWVGRQAQCNGLVMSQFEYRERLETPEAWLPEGRGDLGLIPGWESGRLPESKYQSYRHDLLVGSFHPSHRAKWTAHELMHGIQGFAWQPQATPFFHALAAWMAEILPVAIWYFFDEADLRRCDAHQGQGPLFGTYCVACEEAASQGRGPVDGAWWEQGAQFIRQQLDAVWRSQSDGQLRPHRYVTLDLASDGLAYAAAHGSRLASESFAQFMARFPPTCTSLDAYAERIERLTQALLEDGDLEVEFDRGFVVAQDLAWRLLQLRAQADGEVAQSLLGLVDDLASGADPETVIGAYQVLHEAWVLPEPNRVFAVGYPLTQDLGLSRAQIKDGLNSSAPRSLKLLVDEELEQFVAGEGLERVHLARRFAASLRQQGREDLADLAQLEAALADPPKADLEALTLPPQDLGGPWRLGLGHEVIRSAWNLLAALDGADLQPGACSLLVVSDAQNQVQLLELDEATADWLEILEGPPPEAQTLAALVQLGVLVSARYGL